MTHDARVRVLQKRVVSESLDAFLVTDLTNVLYLTGFSGTNGQLLVSAGDVVFMTDPRYEARSRDLVRDAEIVFYVSEMTEAFAPRLWPGARLGIESASMTVAEKKLLSEALEGVEIVDTKGVVEDQRRAKDEAELARIKEAIRIGDEAFEWISGRLTPGRTEREIALELEVHMRKSGAEAVSFDPIVGSGPLSAHIHHSPSDRAIGAGELVLLDFGCRFEGYCSDMTRTVVVGRASEEQKELYGLVLRAQGAGVAGISEGASGVEVDARAREVIDGAGFAERFGHGLGHGVGLDIHEAPRLHRTSKDALVAGDVVTVEPGIYIPGEGGVRIEDCVLVTTAGAQVLGSAPKEALLEV